jgi:mycofactocin precursor peptide peptidase
MRVETDGDSRHLDRLTTSDLAVAKDNGWLLAVPLGSTEQHGPHLPLATDTIVAVELCRRLASGRSDVVVSAPVGFGSSGEHAGFAGTISIGQDALELLLVELGRSAVETFDHVLFVSGHGGNAEAAGRAVGRLRAESRDALLYLPRVEGDLHAGRSETSMMLALAPELVDSQCIVAGDTRQLNEIWSQLRSGGVAAVSASGVLGDPTGASAAEGAALLDVITTDLLAEVERWRGGGSA